MSNRKGYYIGNQYGLYFLTFTIVGWVDVFTRKECKDIIMDSFRYCVENKGLVICAYVIMENHIHLVTRAKEDSSGLSAIVRDFKKFTSNRILDFVMNSKKESRKDWMMMVFKYNAKYNKNNKDFQVWQQHNRPKEMLHPKFIFQKINYIHRNPVVSGVVDSEEDYLHSSARNYIEREDFLMKVEVIDFGVQNGYVFM